VDLGNGLGWHPPLELSYVEKIRKTALGSNCVSFASGCEVESLVLLILFPIFFFVQYGTYAKIVNLNTYSLGSADNTFTLFNTNLPFA